MNLSKQIKSLRNQKNMSQEALAEKIYVSRQSISNWENERSYPDIHNLLMMSVLFNVSLDELVKGDVRHMKEILQKSNFIKWSYVMIAFLVIVPVSIAPVIYFFGYPGLVITLILYVILMFAALKIEKVKKEYNLKTYRQIVEFMEGRPVSKENPSNKDKWIKPMLIFASALISFILVYMGMYLFGI